MANWRSNLRSVVRGYFVDPTAARLPADCTLPQLIQRRRSTAPCVSTSHRSSKSKPFVPPYHSKYIHRRQVVHGIVASILRPNFSCVSGWPSPRNHSAGTAKKSQLTRSYNGSNSEHSEPFCTKELDIAEAFGLHTRHYGKSLPSKPRLPR